ncbi:SPFH domain-containing protein [Tistrella bauzanensis]|uniref:SPFH domain-containing protein n=1 Tax=Tistrella arctica TaxID=3133430 RepID=A0ABU9YPW8_9PROT
MTVADMAGSDEPGFFGRIGAWFWRHIWSITITVLVLLAAIILLWPMVFITVPAGHAGVVWYRFGGTNVDETRGEGLQFIWPWDRLEIYDVRFQTVTQTYDAITADGLTVGTTISFRFRLDEKYVGILHKNVGPDYLYKIIIPEVGSVTRARISQYTAEDFYSNLRTIVQTEIYEGVKTNFLRGSSYSAEGVDLIELEDVLIKAIHLPDRVAQAIERKVEQYQRQLEYDFRLASEQKEAERKRIEGEGIRMLFDQVGDAQIPDYLTWLGINATVQLAQSRNGKMVIIGNKDSGGMPLILGGIDSGGSQAVSTLERDRAGNPLIAGDNNVGTVAIDPLGTGINGHDAADATGVTIDTAGTAGPPSSGDGTAPRTHGGRMDTGESEAIIEGRVPAAAAANPQRGTILTPSAAAAHGFVPEAAYPQTSNSGMMAQPGMAAAAMAGQPGTSAAGGGMMPPGYAEHGQAQPGYGQPAYGAAGSQQPPSDQMGRSILPGQPITVDQVARWLGWAEGGELAGGNGRQGFGAYGVVPETAPRTGAVGVAGSGG